MEPIKFEYQHDDSDFDAAAGFIAKGILRKRLLSVVLFTIFFTILVAWWFFTGMFEFAVGVGLGSFAINLAYLLRYKSHAKRLWKSNPQTLERFHVTLSDEALVYTTPTVGAKRLWANFQYYAEIPEHLLLFQGENNPVMWLPKRSFPDKVNEVRALIASKLPQKTK